MYSFNSTIYDIVQYRIQHSEYRLVSCSEAVYHRYMRLADLPSLADLRVVRKAEKVLPRSFAALASRVSEPGSYSLP